MHNFLVYRKAPYVFAYYKNMLTLFGTPEKKRWKIWETEQFYIPLLRKYNLPDGELRLAVKQQRERLHINDFQ